MNRSISIRLTSLCAGLFVLTVVAVHANPSQVAVFTGYNDGPRNGSSYSSGSGQPLPWYGSANTTFYGNSTTAQAFDPDEDAILLQNLGGSAVTLTAASIASSSYNLFSLDSIVGSVTLDPGAFVILAGVDGSEYFGIQKTVGLTIDGNDYSYLDVATAQAPRGVLAGASPYIGIGNSESIPWTSLYTPPTNSVPDESSTLWMAGFAVIGLVYTKRLLDARQVA